MGQVREERAVEAAAAVVAEVVVVGCSNEVCCSLALNEMDDVHQCCCVVHQHRLESVRLVEAVPVDEMNCLGYLDYHSSLLVGDVLSGDVFTRKCKSLFKCKYEIMKLYKRIK